MSLITLEHKMFRAIQKKFPLLQDDLWVECKKEVTYEQVAKELCKDNTEDIKKFAKHSSLLQIRSQVIRRHKIARYLNNNGLTNMQIGIKIYDTNYVSIVWCANNTPFINYKGKYLTLTGLEYALMHNEIPVDNPLLYEETQVDKTLWDKICTMYYAAQTISDLINIYICEEGFDVD